MANQAILEQCWAANSPYFLDYNKFTIRQTLYQGQTAYQDVLILDTHEFGKMLFINGSCQSAQSDEYIYHECLVHPAMLGHAEPREVLIIGSAEGATLREVLRHPSVERVVMVDIDGTLVDVCEQFLPEWHCDAFEDPRVELVLHDACDFVQTCKDSFDVIIVDICEVLSDKQQEGFYGDCFFQHLKQLLRPQGLVVVQTMELGEQMSKHRFVSSYLRKLFYSVDSYRVFIPSFSSMWSFVVANDFQPLHILDVDFIDEALARRHVDQSLKFYDGAAHQHLFALSKDMKATLGL